MNYINILRYSQKNKWMKRLLYFIIVATFIFGYAVTINASTSTNQDHHKEEVKTEHVDQANQHDQREKTHQSHEEHDEGHGHMEPLLFVILALLIGAATRYLLRKSFLPYTVSLLIIGILLGVFSRLGYFSDLASIQQALSWAGNIDPHLILYVFLPTLIFEAAFAMDVHTFKKTFTNATIMAIPGLLIAMFLTGALMIMLAKSNLGYDGWGWEMALLFGAVVSATDPVAVVALLKDLGASKKLSTLIEGESLLNDGTAIVIFMVFFLGITGGATGGSPIVEFFRVAVGGALLGVVIGYITMKWVERVFNDALVEISVIVGAAYITFFIAEHFLHVSGVLGVVALGLVMAGAGRTKISPGVEHFLHEFWELFAFIANTLIFIIVGVVIAERTVFTSIDFLILLILFVGIFTIRALVIALFFPAMRKIGYGIKKKETPVVWWGALRGAIGLALALVVAGVDDQYIPATIKNQFLFLTAGIVTMTLVINATTIKWLVDKLGITKLPPAKALMLYSARQYLHDSVKNHADKLKNDRQMSKANWGIVQQYFPESPEDQNIEEIQVDTIAETRRRILEKEKSSYWHQFKEGYINSSAVRTLTDAINEIIDAGGRIPLSNRKDLEQLWKTPKFLHKLTHLPVLGKLAERTFFERLTISYDAARGFLEAQKEVMNLVGSMYRSADEANGDTEKNLAIIEEEINENQIHGQTFIRNLRKNYPEIYKAIATRQATRTTLNYELKTIERLKKNGRISSAEAEKMVASVEERMKKLQQKPPTAEFPEIYDVVKNISWLKDLNASELNHVINMFHKQVYAVGENIMKEGTTGDSLHLLIRGSAKVTYKNHLVELVQEGSTIGEMSVLTGLPRKATVVAESPVTTLRLKVIKAQKLFQQHPEMADKLWEIAAHRFALHLLKNEPEGKNLTKGKDINTLMEHAELKTFQQKEKVSLTSRIGILLYGKALDPAKPEERLEPPKILTTDEIYFQENSRVLFLDR
jgi:NhaP-type Na+/H+ or K+/H+ antiporter